MAKKKIETSEQTLTIPIEYRMPDGIITPFATNMIVQTIEHEFKISFFEIKPFIRINESEPIPDKVKADCVASVIVSADRLPKFIKALQTQLEKFNLTSK
jgi:hypothetical protein